MPKQNLRPKLLKKRLKKPKKPSKRLKKPNRKPWKKNNNFWRILLIKNLRLKSQKSVLKKLHLIWRKLKRELPTGKSKQWMQRKKLLKKWPMPKLLKKSMKQRWRQLD